MFKVILICFCFTSLAAQARPAADVAKICIACHGVEGKSGNEEWPNLAGQKSRYLVQQLHDFKNDLRVNKLMSPVAKMLNDQEIESIAQYFSQLKGE